MNELAGKHSNSVTLESDSNNISDNSVQQHSYASDGNVNIYERYGIEYGNYDLSGYEHYPHQEVQLLADGGQLRGTLDCNDDFEYDPQFLVCNEQLNSLIWTVMMISNMIPNSWYVMNS